MQQFRLKDTKIIKAARPGTMRHGVLSRSHRYELLDEAIKSPEPEASPQLADLTIKQLLQRADEEGVALDSKSRKAKMVEVLRDAGVSPVARVDVAEAGTEDIEE